MNVDNIETKENLAAELGFFVPDTLATSRKQIPAGIKHVEDLYPLWNTGLEVLNFGCGKYPELANEYFKHELGTARAWHYDPNLVDHPFAYTEIGDIKRRFYDVVFCCNVLNVMPEAVLDHVLHQLADLNAGAFIIQIYEGDKSGKSKVTRDGYQRNAKTSDYMADIYRVFGHCNIRRKGHYIVVTR